MLGVYSRLKLQEKKNKIKGKNNKTKKNPPKTMPNYCWRVSIKNSFGEVLGRFPTQCPWVRLRWKHDAAAVAGGLLAAAPLRVACPNCGQIICPNE